MKPEAKTVSFCSDFFVSCPNSPWKCKDMANDALFIWTYWNAFSLTQRPNWKKPAELSLLAPSEMRVCGMKMFHTCF